MGKNLLDNLNETLEEYSKLKLYETQNEETLQLYLLVFVMSYSGYPAAHLATHRGLQASVGCTIHPSEIPSD
jgi:hypothetical protein